MGWVQRPRKGELVGHRQFPPTVCDPSCPMRYKRSQGGAWGSLLTLKDGDKGRASPCSPLNITTSRCDVCNCSGHLLQAWIWSQHQTWHSREQKESESLTTLLSWCIPTSGTCPSSRPAVMWENKHIWSTYLLLTPEITPTDTQGKEAKAKLEKRKAEHKKGIRKRI